MSKLLRILESILLVAVAALVGALVGNGIYRFLERMYPLDTEGTLFCTFSDGVTVQLVSKHILYLGNGEWKLQHPGGKYTVYSKSVGEACVVVPGEPIPPPAPPKPPETNI